MEENKILVLFMAGLDYLNGLLAKSRTGHENIEDLLRKKSTKISPEEMLSLENSLAYHEGQIAAIDSNLHEFSHGFRGILRSVYMEGKNDGR